MGGKREVRRKRKVRMEGKVGDDGEEGDGEKRIKMTGVMGTEKVMGTKDEG